MKIREKFLELTGRTYPHGTEKDLFNLLPSNLKEDEFGNLFIQIGESDVMFTSHLDTATSALSPIKHVIEGNIIKTDGTSILGADDKAGVVIMIHMIENNIPGLYYFFLGEEVGCIGSKKVSTKHSIEKNEKINKVISFDRRGNSSVITFQSSSRCCSDKFGESLSKELNEKGVGFSYKNDPTGIYTDSAQFVRIYAECTNISVGYQNEHTFSESQDIDHLEKLAEACLKIDWNSLPVERDPSKVEYSSYGYYGRGWNWDDDDYCTGGGIGYSSNNSYRSTYVAPKTRADKIWFHDEKFNYVSNMEVETFSKKIISVDLHEDRVHLEKVIIDDLLKALELEFETTHWDGFTLTVNYKFNHSTKCDRNDLIEYLPELNYSEGDGPLSAVSIRPESESSYYD